MPPRGGRDDFTNEHIAAIVSYVRALQVPSRVAESAIPDVPVAVLDDLDDEEPAGPQPAQVQTAEAKPVEAGPVDAPVAAAPVAEKETSVSAPEVSAAVAPEAQPVVFDADTLKRGKRVYNSCIACHGKTGGGVAGTGADLLHSQFVRTKSNEELRAFIKVGRAPGAPGSVLNLNMPAKGGNPALKDNQIDDVVTYIRSLQQSADAN